ncbi:MAG: tRNA (adenosine(37)-N6)-threonylcarbamoyltransferase complex ATPase subunit type 1 TsaE [Armatimonadetes bacterium]|nr:tRNA (adenosine(37)-N6)-threonylcarbamoyltransferase complex ATPase subunit type 1 TsaE [Armatimonadota bacterium]
MTRYQFETNSTEETESIGAALGAVLRAGDVIALTGELGAGKTCFVRGLARGIGVRDAVTSPTFILIREHRGDPGLCHADAYRLSSGAELEDLGLEDILSHSVFAVEWAERVADALPPDRIEVHLEYEEDGRRITLTALGDSAAERLREALA